MACVFAYSLLTIYYNGTYDHSAVLLHSNNMLILVVSFVVVLFVPSCAGKTNNIIGMYKCIYVANLNCFQVTE